MTNSYLISSARQMGSRSNGVAKRRILVPCSPIDSLHGETPESLDDSYQYPILSGEPHTWDLDEASVSNQHIQCSFAVPLSQGQLGISRLDWEAPVLDNLWFSPTFLSASFIPHTLRGSSILSDAYSILFYRICQHSSKLKAALLIVSLGIAVILNLSPRLFRIPMAF